MPDEDHPNGLSKDEIIASLARLNDFLAEANVIGELCLLTLIKHLGFKTSDEVMENVARFFPPERILPKTQFMIHEAISGLDRNT